MGMESIWTKAMESQCLCPFCFFHLLVLWLWFGSWDNKMGIITYHIELFTELNESRHVRHPEYLKWSLYCSLLAATFWSEETGFQILLPMMNCCPTLIKVCSNLLHHLPQKDMWWVYENCLCWSQHALKSGSSFPNIYGIRPTIDMVLVS